jgi:hypothetical protein
VSAPSLDPETEALFAALRRRIADRNAQVRDAIAQAKAALDELGEAIRRDTLAHFARLNEVDGPASGDTLDAADLAREAFEGVLALAGDRASRVGLRVVGPAPEPPAESAPAQAAPAPPSDAPPEPAAGEPAAPPEPEFADSQFLRDLNAEPKRKWVYTPPERDEPPAAPEPAPAPQGGPPTPEQLPALNALLAEGGKLLLVGGLHMEAKVRRVDRAVGGRFEWVHAHQKDTLFAAAAQKIRGGRWPAVVLFEGLSGTAQIDQVREACRAAGVPMVFGGTAGTGQIDGALRELERIVAKGRRVA